MADVVEIGLFGEVLADKSVGIFIQPFLPRMVGTAKIGDWETDTIVGKDQRRTLLTLVERVTRYTIICKLKNFKAKDTTNTVIRVLKAHKARVHTITMGNGQRTTDNGQRTTDNGQRTTDNGQRQRILTTCPNSPSIRSKNLCWILG